MPPYHGATGAVFLFDEKTGRHLSTLNGSVHSGAQLFGWSLAISRNTLVIGAPHADTGMGLNAGGVYVYDLPSRKLIQTIQPETFLQANEWGYSVPIDGEWLAIGGPYADTQGAAELWRLGSTTRLRRINTAGLLVANNARFGQAVAIQNGILAVGAPGEYVAASGNHAGRVFVFDAVADSLLFEGNTVSGTAGEEFGFALAMNGNLLAVAAPFAPNPGGGSGIAALYRLNNLSNGYVNYAGAGPISSVAIDQGVLVMGISGTAIRIGNSVDPYLPFPHSVVSTDGLGASVAIRGSTVVATAPGDKSRGLDSGAYWRFSPVLPKEVLPGVPTLATGDSMAGSGNSTLSTITSAVPSLYGYPLMIGTLAGWDTTSQQKAAVWVRRGLTNEIQMLARAGVPPAQARWSSFSQVLTREDNWHWLRGTIAGPGITAANNQAYQYYDAFTFVGTRVLQTGSPIGSGAIRSFTADGRANDTAATVAVPVSYLSGLGVTPATPSSDTGIIEVGLGGLSAEYREGVSVVPGLGLKYGQFPPRCAIQGSNLAFTHFLQGAPAVSNQVVRWLGVEQARTGTTAQTSFAPLSNYTSFVGEVGNGAYCVFRANLALSATAGITSRSNEGLFSNRIGYPVKLVLLKGLTFVFSSGSAPAGTISRFLEYGIASNGDIMALVQLSGTGINRSNDMALVLAKAGPNGTTEVLLREGDAAPGCHGARIGSILNVDFTGHRSNTSNHYAVIASLVVEAGGATASDNLVVLRGNTRQGTASQLATRRPYLMLRKGRQELSGAGLQTYTSFSLPCVIRDPSGALNTGLGHMVDSFTGAMLVKATLSTGRQELLPVD